MIEENVVRAEGVPFHSKSIEEYVHVAKKDTLYNVLGGY